MPIYAHQRFDDKDNKPQILFLCLTRRMQQHARIGRKTPVVVFSAAINACKRLFVKQHTEAVFTCHLLHQRHQQHIMIYRKVGFFKDRSQLKLVGCHLVMTCFAGNTQFERLNFEVFHKRLNPFGDGAEVVIVHLLIFGRVVSHQRSARQHQVGTGKIKTLVYQKILLFPSQITRNLLHLWVKILCHSSCRTVYGLQRAQQGCLIVERFACVRNKDGRNTKCVVNDKDRRCGVPSRISARFKGVANTATGKRRCIGFLLHEQLSRKLFYHSTLSVGLNKSIMFLCRAFGKRLKPMGIMRNTVLVGPFFHAHSYGVGNVAVKSRTVIDNIY